MVSRSVRFSVMCAVMCGAIALTQSTLGDDQGRTLSPLQMYEAVSPEIRARATELLKTGDTAGAIAEIAGKTSLTDQEAATFSTYLDFEWKKRAELDVLTNQVMGRLAEADQARIVALVVERKQTTAIAELGALTGMTAQDAMPIVSTIERRLVAAGHLKPVAQGNSPEGVLAGLDADTRARIMELAAGGKKIQAIKELRAATSLGLKDSKDIVDAVMATGN